MSTKIVAERNKKMPNQCRAQQNGTKLIHNAAKWLQRNNTRAARRGPRIAGAPERCLVTSSFAAGLLRPAPADRCRTLILDARRSFKLYPISRGWAQGVRRLDPSASYSCSCAKSRGGPYQGPGRTTSTLHHLLSLPPTSYSFFYKPHLQLPPHQSLPYNTFLLSL